VLETILGAEMIAPSCFVAAKMKDQPRPFNSRAELFDWLTLDQGSTLPAFSTPWWCRDFVRLYWVGDKNVMPRPLLRSVFAVAEVIEHLEGVERVVFDPEAIGPGVWSHPKWSMSASYCRRLAREMRPDIEKLFKGAEAQVGGDYFGNPDDLQKIRELCEPSVPEVARNAHARTAEWEARDS
jgi:hypothetical protein